MLVNGIGGGCVAGLGAINSELFPTEIRLTCMGGVYGVAR